MQGVEESETWVCPGFFLEKEDLEEIAMSSLKTEGNGAGEMAQGLIMLHALPEDWSWVPREALASMGSLSPQFWGIQCPLLSSMGTRHAHGV